jgi:hypothetical protein
MGYTPQDLDVFLALRDQEQLKGTAYFELHPGDLPEPFACWLPGSLFMKDAGFDFFVACFERANPSFNYFAFEKFEASQIAALLDHLLGFVVELTLERSRDVVFSRYNSVFTADIWDGVGTQELRAAVLVGAQELAAFIRESCPGNRCLWVLGM